MFFVRFTAVQSFISVVKWLIFKNQLIYFVAIISFKAVCASSSIIMLQKKYSGSLLEGLLYQVIAFVTLPFVAMIPNWPQHSFYSYMDIFPLNDITFRTYVEWSYRLHMQIIHSFNCFSPTISLTSNKATVDHNHCYVHHLSKQVNVSLTMLDTAGQERFDSICTVSNCSQS